MITADDSAMTDLKIGFITPGCDVFETAGDTDEESTIWTRKPDPVKPTRML